MREEARVRRAKRKAGRFIQVTNVAAPDAEALPAEEVLETYLGQQVVERASGS